MDQTRTVSSYEIADFALFFNQLKDKYHVEGQAKENIFEYTVINVDYSPNNNLKDETNIQTIFHFAVVNSIQFLNHFIDALRSKHNLRSLNNFTIIDLPRLIDVEYDGSHYDYVTNPIDTVIDQPVLNKDDVIEALKLLSKWDKYPEIEVVEKFFDKAKYHLAKEQFIFALIELQTSFECFIRNTHRLILLNFRTQQTSQN